jgi:hypothetical protein
VSRFAPILGSVLVLLAITSMAVLAHPKQGRNGASLTTGPRELEGAYKQAVIAWRAAEHARLELAHAEQMRNAIEFPVLPAARPSTTFDHAAHGARKP